MELIIDIKCKKVFQFLNASDNIIIVLDFTTCVTLFWAAATTYVYSSNSSDEDINVDEALLPSF